MCFKNFIRNFNSKDLVGNYNTVLSNKLVCFLNNIYNLDLVNLNLLEDKYRNYSWYVDKKSSKVFNLLISLLSLSLLVQQQVD